MTAKIISFLTGKELPNNKLTTDEKESIEVKLKREEKIKYAKAITDDLMMHIIHSCHHEGLNIGKPDPKVANKTFMDLGIFLEAFRGLIYRELDLEHPFHYLTDNYMFPQKDEKSGKTYSVIDYEGKKIVDREDNDEIEFEGENLDNDTDRLQPDSDK